jgi:hypothetical protein
MSDVVVLVKQSVLQGVYSTPSKVWEAILKKEPSPKTLYFKTSPTECVEGSKSLFTKLIKQRKMMRVYKKRMLDKYKKGGDIENCPSLYNCWMAEVNANYKMSKSYK